MSVTSLDLYVPIKLDKPRRIKLTIDDTIAIYDELNATVPPPRTEMGLFTLLQAMATLNWKVWDCVMSYAMRHQDPSMDTPEKVHPLLTRYAQNDGDMERLGLMVRRAMMLSGALPRKIWEKVDAKAWQKYLDEAGGPKDADAPALEEAPTGASESTT